MDLYVADDFPWSKRKKKTLITTKDDIILFLGYVLAKKIKRNIQANYIFDIIECNGKI